MYRVSFHQAERDVACLVEGYLERDKSQTTLWIHSVHFHVRLPIVILEEGNRPLPWCPQCDLCVSWEGFNGRKLAIKMCSKGAEQERRRWVEKVAHASTAAAFQAYGGTLEAVTSFKYLVRVMTTSNYDWTAVVNYLGKAWRKWERFYRISGWEGDDSRTSRTLYKAVVQAKLFFGLETWAMTPRIRHNLGVLHQRVYHCLVEMKTRHEKIG